MNVRVRQNGPRSVEVSWEIEGDTNVGFEVCYRGTQNDETCTSPRLAHDVRTKTVDDLQVGVLYTFQVISFFGASSVPSSTSVITLVVCNEGRLMGGTLVDYVIG